MDSFDKTKTAAEKEAEEKELKKAEKKEFTAWQKAFCDAIEGKWFEFDHPEHGKVKGECVHAVYDGLTEVGKIPDFACHFIGRTGKELIVSLVETNAQQCPKP